ncbi:tetratricopeptide repeat protein, partial [Calditrichota bacterium]
MKEIRKKAREALKDGNVGEALDLFNAQIKIEPDDQLTLRYLVQIHERRGDFVRAGEVLEKLSKLNRSDETLTMLAQNALKRQAYDEAIS